MPAEKETKKSRILTDAHEKYRKGLNVHAFFKIHNNDIGEDLVQDTFMKTWKYLAKGGKIDIMKAFLYHILNDLIIDEYRKRKTSSLNELLEKGFEIEIDDSEKNIDIMDGKAALLLIDLLPAKDKAIIKMRYVDELSIEEMAGLTDQTRKTIPVQIHRGMGKLKALYEYRN